MLSADHLLKHNCMWNVHPSILWMLTRNLHTVACMGSYANQNACLTYCTVARLGRPKVPSFAFIFKLCITLHCITSRTNLCSQVTVCVSVFVRLWHLFGSLITQQPSDGHLSYLCVHCIVFGADLMNIDEGLWIQCKKFYIAITPLP